MEAPYLAIKKARIARAGKQVYHSSEVALRGLKPEKVKDAYVEYRPPEVVLRHISDFNYLKFTNDHPGVALTEDTWRDHIIGVIGGCAAVEVTDDNEIFITNEVVFYDQKAYDDYKAGKVEISAGYESVSVPVKNSDSVGYDFLMTDITKVEHAALCDRARAGHNARILDSLDIDRLTGGSGTMGKKVSLLGFLRGEAKDDKEALSKTVFDSLAKFDKLSSEEQQKEIAGVVSRVASLGDSEEKEYLVSAIADSFKNAAGALERKEEVGKILDGLHDKCKEIDAASAKAVVDSILGGGATDAEKEAKEKAEKEAKEKAEKEAKEKAAKEGGGSADAEQRVDAAVAKALAGVADSVAATVKGELPALVEKTVKEALGIKDAAGADGSKTVDSLDALEEELDSSFLLDGVFGSR
jgi:hypothetical protein